jgi:hypothetical protein
MCMMRSMESTLVHCMQTNLSTLYPRAPCVLTPLSRCQPACLDRYLGTVDSVQIIPETWSLVDGQGEGERHSHIKYQTAIKNMDSIQHRSVVRDCV